MLFGTQTMHVCILAKQTHTHWTRGLGWQPCWIWGEIWFLQINGHPWYSWKWHHQCFSTLFGGQTRHICTLNMINMLKNGRHLEISNGPSDKFDQYSLESKCTEFGKCIMICMVQPKFRHKLLHYRPALKHSSPTCQWRIRLYNTSHVYHSQRSAPKKG